MYYKKRNKKEYNPQLTFAVSKASQCVFCTLTIWCLLLMVNYLNKVVYFNWFFVECYLLLVKLNKTVLNKKQ